MRAAVDGVDVVDVAVDVLGVLAAILEGDLDLDAGLRVLVVDVDHVVVDGFGRPVQVADELDHAVAVLERLAVAGPRVLEDDLHAAVQEGQLLQPLVEDVVVELQVAEDLVVGLEGGLRAGAVGDADARDRAGRLAALVLLLVDVPAAADLDLAPVGEEIDGLHADAVQAAGGLVRLVVELAAVLEHRHHAFQGGAADARVGVDGDAAAVVGHGDRAVAIDGHLNDLGEAGHHLVDRIIDHLGHQVVHAADVAVADVHAGPLADVLQVAHVAHLADVVFGAAVVAPGPWASGRSEAGLQIDVGRSIRGLSCGTDSCLGCLASDSARVVARFTHHSNRIQSLPSGSGGS